MAKMLDIGYKFTYPDFNWERACRIPEKVAVAWVTELFGKDINMGCGPLVNEFNHNSWLNKLAIVVENDDSRGCIALYNHDGTYWVIRNKDLWD